MNNRIEKLILEQNTIYVKITSEKNKVDIIYQFFKYYEKRINKKDTVWSCIRRTCSGSFKIKNDDGMIILGGCNPHKHEKYTATELRIIFSKDAIFTDSVNARKLHKQAIAESSICLDDNERLSLKVPQINKTIAHRKSKTINYTFDRTYEIFPRSLKGPTQIINLLIMITLKIKQIE